MNRPNKAFYALASAAGLAAFAVFVTVASAVRRYRERRAWKRVTDA